MAPTTPRSQPSGTPFTWELRKPHPGLLQFVIVFDDGDSWVWREIEFHDTEKIRTNASAAGPLPSDWPTSSADERSALAALEGAA